MSIKLMDVHGPKILDDEKYTQDMLAVCTPTFVTPNTRENAKLQVWSFRNMPVFYFLNPMDPHLLDFFMQALWNETQYNPLGARYWSCVPYLLGEGQAMMYSFRPRSKVITDIPGVPFGHVPPNYLRDNMVATLAQQDVEFDILVQVQTDPHRMPIENASVRWPEKLSPFVPAATVHIPRQKFDTLAHDAFAKRIVDQSLALPGRAPAARQSEPRAQAHVLAALAPAPGDEPGAAHRADRRRGARVDAQRTDRRCEPGLHALPPARRLEHRDRAAHEVVRRAEVGIDARHVEALREGRAFASARRNPSCVLRGRGMAPGHDPPFHRVARLDGERWRLDSEVAELDHMGRRRAPGWRPGEHGDQEKRREARQPTARAPRPACRYHRDSTNRSDPRRVLRTAPA